MYGSCCLTRIVGHRLVERVSPKTVFFLSSLPHVRSTVVNGLHWTNRKWNTSVSHGPLSHRILPSTSYPCPLNCHYIDDLIAIYRQNCSFLEDFSQRIKHSLERAALSWNRCLAADRCCRVLPEPVRLISFIPMKNPNRTVINIARSK